MNSQIQKILARRKSKVYFKSETTSPAQINKKTGMIGAILTNFGYLGYIIDKELLTELQFASEYELTEFYKSVYPVLQDQVGMTSSYYKPMYPNFPDQVANASNEELYINAIMHYFGDVIGERIVPEYEKEVRFPFCETTNPRFLGLATGKDLDDMWTQIFESKASPSAQDREDIVTFFDSYTPVAMSPDFQNKERMAFVLAFLIRDDKSVIFQNWARRNVKTATDVLRIAVGYSIGDISLTTNTKFGKFPRPVRRILLDLLNDMNVESVKEDFMRHEGAWIRLAEKLHPSEYKHLKLDIHNAFSDLRNGRIKTTNAKIENYLQSKQWSDLISVLKTRPGDFARRLNTILSKANNKFEVIEAFRSVVDKVSTYVLWQLLGYFDSRDKQLEFRNRIFLPKTPKALVSENNLTKIAKAYQYGIAQVVEDALYEKYAQLPTIGKVWIDPICNNLLIPSGNRSASTALRQVARGSRFQLNKDKSTVRLFVYWKDIEAKFQYDRRVDLDLSAIMYDKDFNFLGQCSWTNLRNGSGKNASMVHSGDITSAPNGASEFLDINIDKLTKDVAYIACNVYCFTGQKMNQLNVGYCGWMEREYAGSGEIYEPTSVVGRCDLTADATSTTPMILDVVNREIIWADLAMTLTGWGRSTESTIDKSIATAELVSRMSTTRKSLGSLFNLHAITRGTIVSDREDADFVIAEDGDLSPYDVAKVCSEWL